MNATATKPRLLAAAGSLIATQLIHAVTPARTSAESLVGPISGLILLVLAIMASFGAAKGRKWATRLTGYTGIATAAGFTAYHATPFASPITNPYFGNPVGAPAWISVALVIAAATWAAYEGLAEIRTSRRKT